MKDPKPDREELREVILRKKIPSKVHFFELHIDTEIIRYFTEKFDRRWIEPSLAKDRKSQEVSLKNYIECWYRLGYDCLRFISDFRFSGSLSFASKKKKSKDTVLLSKGERSWVEEGKGIITSWEDFEGIVGLPLKNWTYGLLNLSLRIYRRGWESLLPFPPGFLKF